MDLSINLWHSNNMKVILCKLAKDNYFWILWALNYFGCIPFFYWFFPYGSQSSQKNLKSFIPEFLKNIKPPSFWKAYYKISPVCLSFCLSVCLSVCSSVTNFSQDLRNGFFKFFTWRYIYKTWHSQILENCVSSLDNWVNNTNLDQK